MRFAYAALLVTAFCGVALGGCSTTGPRISSAVEQRILRETTLDDVREGEAQGGDAIVRVVRKGGACSGAVIGPRHILTAQHCVMKLDMNGELTRSRLVAGDVRVELGSGYLPWGRVGVRRVHACGGAIEDVPHDVAILVLSRRLPSDVRRLDLTYDVPAEADVLEASGFGSNEKPKRIPLTLWTVSSVERHTHRGPVTLANDERLAVALSSAPGDSGGPIIDVATGRIASVVSKGSENHDAVHQKRELPAGVLVRTSGPRLTVCRAMIESALGDRADW